MKALPQTKRPGLFFMCRAVSCANGLSVGEPVLPGLRTPSLLRPQGGWGENPFPEASRGPRPRSSASTGYWVGCRAHSSNPWCSQALTRRRGGWNSRQCWRASLRSRCCSAHRKGLGVWLRQAVFKKVAKMHNLKQLCKDFRVFYQNKCIIQFHFLWSSWSPVTLQLQHLLLATVWHQCWDALVTAGAVIRL